MQPQVGEHRKKLLQENCTARAYPRRSPATHCGTGIVCQCERERQRFDMAQVTAEKEVGGNLQYGGIQTFRFLLELYSYTL